LGAIYVLQPEGTAKPQGLKFTIIADSNGFNGSAQLGIPWPFIAVRLGDNLTILVQNQHRLETHGFAITGYFEKGMIVGPGENASISISADVAGNLTMYCNTFCTAHQFMVGTLEVEG
jgi:FtsP/CotA-like multicopper oxidase with cupredoxin domain